MNLAAVMMQKDEVGLLQQWLTYYSELCGTYENLYIFDDRSTEPTVREVLRQAADAGAHVTSCPVGEKGIDIKGRLVSETIRSLGDRYDCYLPTDCDEFVCVASAEGPIIDTIAVRTVISDILSNTSNPFIRLRGSFVNIPGTTSVRQEHQMKLVLRSLPPGLTLDNGYHLYNFRRRREVVAHDLMAPSSLCYLHCHYKPFWLLQRAARDKLEPYVADFDLSALRSYRGDSRHVVKYLLMTEEEYLDRFASDPGIVPNREVQELLAAINYGWAESVRTRTSAATRADPPSAFHTNEIGASPGD